MAQRLWHSTLRRANLCGANLHGAHLDGAKLENAQADPEPSGRKALIRAESVLY